MRILFIGLITVSISFVNVQTSTAQWEAVYGTLECTEEGRANAMAPFFPGNSFCGAIPIGFITAGWSYSSVNSPDPCSPTSDIYLVRTDQNGTIMWANTYDIGGNDYAHDIKLCANGDFIITGQTENTPTNLPGMFDAFLMRIDPCGTVLWVQTYGTNNDIIEAFEVVEAIYGDPTGMTASVAGDFVVAGSYTTTTGLADALLFRTDANGNLVWDMTYGTTTDEDRFKGLTETTAIGAGLVPGDIVATGWTNGQLNPGADLLLARVNAFNGLIGPAPQGIIANGGFQDDAGEGVIELQTPPNAGDIVVAGHSYSPTNIVPGSFWTGREIFLMKTGPAVGAGPLAQILHGEQGPLDDFAMSLTEKLAVPPGGPPLGTIVVTGGTSLGGFGGLDAFLLEVYPAPAPPVCPPPCLPLPALGATVGMGVSGFSFHGGRNDDIGYSLVNTPYPAYQIPGYHVTGVETSNLAGGPFMSPMKYVFWTNPAGGNGCDIWDPGSQLVTSFPWGLVGTPLGSVLSVTSSGTTESPLTQHFPVCSPPAPKNLPGNSEDEDSQLSSYPNPIHRGDIMQLEYTSLETQTQVEITIIDAKGVIVHQNHDVGASGKHVYEIPTSGWAPGSYVVSIQNGKSRLVEKVVVLDK